MSTSRGSEDQQQKRHVAELTKTLKEGERILAPTRRPDGTLRKPIRIRAGCTPQEEVAIYQPKPALMMMQLRKEMASQIGPPGYDPSLDAKPKTKSVKRNERMKEKKLQAALERAKNLESNVAEDNMKQESTKNLDHTSESVQSITSQMNELAVSGSSSVVSPNADGSEPTGASQDIDKRIRALKKKIRQTEALQQKTAEQDLKPEQLEKLAKLEDWRKELKSLEDAKAETTRAA